MEYKHAQLEGHQVIHFIHVLPHEFLEISQGWRFKKEFADRHGEGEYVICYQEEDGRWGHDYGGRTPYFDLNVLETLLWTDEELF